MVELTNLEWRFVESLIFDEVKRYHKDYPEFAEINKSAFGDLLQKVINNRRETAYETIAIDTETTGLDSNEDEILQVSIIGGGNEVLYNCHFKPKRHETWEEAEKVNHISPRMVLACDTINREVVRISEALSRAKKIIGYNTPFDLAFLRAAGIQIPESAEIVDVMQMFTEIKGDPQKRHKLTECAEYYSYQWEGAAHDSAADAKATLYCYNQMIKRGVKNET